jgi:Cupin-like domain
MEPDSRHADSIVDGYFVEPHQNTIPFSEILDWLLSRKGMNQKGPIRYVQSQNDNLSGDFKRLKRDIQELDWANECFGSTNWPVLSDMA